LKLDWVLGNAWADYFAKEGARSVGYAEGYVNLFKSAMVQAKLGARLLSYTLCRVLQLKIWGDREVDEPIVRKQKEVVQVLEHTFWVSADEGEAFSPWRREAVNYALAAATTVLGEDGDHYRQMSDATGAPLLQAQAHFAELGHTSQWSGQATVCTRCARTASDVTKKVLKLRDKCPGAAQCRETRRSQVKRILRFAKSVPMEFHGRLHELLSVPQGVAGATMGP
ncbi:unnamed protein product, partial [Prorocentrum cordatum]